MLRPFLYVEGYGPSQPVLTSGALSTQFLWDRALGFHVHRFKDLADFRARCKDVLLNEQVWKILFGLEEVEDRNLEIGDGEDGSEPSSELPTPNSEELLLCLTACQQLADGEALDLAKLADFVACHPAILAVARLADQAKAVDLWSKELAEAKAEIARLMGKKESPPSDGHGAPGDPVTRDDIVVAHETAADGGPMGKKESPPSADSKSPTKSRKRKPPPKKKAEG